MTIEQSQKLSMTPELIQAIQILQYNNEELDNYIKNQLLENPMLEIESEKERDEEKESSFNDTFENTSISIDDLRDKIAENLYNTDSFRQWDSTDSQEDFSYERYVSFRYSLIEHLLLQLQFVGLDEDLAEIGRFLIHNIDENGYLSISIEEIAETMNTDLEKVEKVLSTVQTFDPAGVGARSLCETLIIQLRLKNELNPDLERIICDHLEDIASNRIGIIAKEIGKSEKEVQHITDVIKSLEPKPGRGYDSDRTVKYVIPDIVIKKNGGEYVVSNYDAGTPSLNVSSYYNSIRANMKDDPELGKYLNERLNSAIWLIKSIEQRKQTIKKVAEAILEHQREYFDKGEHYLKPLTLKEIAETVGVHESTVSRAVNGKYMQTCRGVLEMKYFFTSGIKADDGQGISSNSIKARMREIIDNEDPEKPYSDQKIVEILKGEGIDISRRTVAKYRDAAGILPTSKRKRF